MPKILLVIKTKMINLGSHKFWHFLYYVYMLVVLFGLAMVSYWSLDRQLPRIILSGTATPSHVKPGDTLHLKWRVIGVRHCPGIAIRTLEDECGSHLIYNGPMANLTLGLDKESEININFVIPLTVSPGRCEFHTMLIQYCNPIHYLAPLEQSLKPLIFYVDKP